MPFNNLKLQAKKAPCLRGFAFISPATIVAVPQSRSWPPFLYTCKPKEGSHEPFNQLMTPGTIHTTSKAFDPTRSLIVFVICVALAALSGFLYAFISRINPIVYLNLLLLAGEIGLLILIAWVVKIFGESRNFLVDLLLCFAICIVAWLANWAYYMTLETGSGFFANLLKPVATVDFAISYSDTNTIYIGNIASGNSYSGPTLKVIYLAEFVAFMLPFCFTSKKRKAAFYCKKCKNAYTTVPFFTEEANRFNAEYAVTEKGDYSFLSTFNITRMMQNLSDDPGSKPEIIKANYHYCTQCNDNSIVDFSVATLQLNSENKREFVNEKQIVSGMCIDEVTNQVIYDKLATASS